MELFHLTKKEDWRNITAKFDSELTYTRIRAEGNARRIQTYLKGKPEENHLNGLYDKTEASYNKVAQLLIDMLRANQNPKEQPDLTTAKADYEAFMYEAGIALGDIDRTKVTLGQFALSIPDPVKIFSEVMKTIEWFKDRTSKERHDLADDIEKNLVRDWPNVGTPINKSDKKNGGGKKE